MKKLILTITMAMMSLVSVTAQEKEEQEGEGFSKGDVYVSGTVSFRSESNDNFKLGSYTLSPSVGYFVSNNIALETALIIGSEKFEFLDREQKVNSFGGSVGGSYYFAPLNKFSFNTGVSFSYVRDKFENDLGFDILETNREENVDTNTFGVVITPGVNYFISNAFALRASIGVLSYRSTKEDTSGAEAENIFSLNLDLSDINFGLSYRF